MDHIKLSIIIPAYNEEKRLARTLREIDSYVSRQNYGYEILVISDGSKDNTAGLVNSLIPEIRNLRLIDRKENKGKGFSVRQAMLEAKGDFRIFTDADNSTSIDQVEKIWPELEKGFDVVIGSRDIKGAVLDPPQPFIRNIILGEGFKLFRKLAIGLWDLEDTQCGFKLFKKEVVEKVFPKCLINRFAFDPEMLVLARKYGFKVKEIPVYWKNDLESTVKFKGMVKMASDLLAIRFNLLSKKYG
jgi:dolichyl-phosphate beta-glucosyltransferase